MRDLLLPSPAPSSSTPLCRGRHRRESVANAGIEPTSVSALRPMLLMSRRDAREAVTAARQAADAQFEGTSKGGAAASDCSRRAPPRPRPPRPPRPLSRPPARPRRPQPPPPAAAASAAAAAEDGELLRDVGCAPHGQVRPLLLYLTKETGVGRGDDRARGRGARRSLPPHAFLGALLPPHPSRCPPLLTPPPGLALLTPSWCLPP